MKQRGRKNHKRETSLQMPDDALVFFAPSFLMHATICHGCNRRKSVRFFDTQLPIVQCPCPCPHVPLPAWSVSRHLVNNMYGMCVRCFQPPDNGGLAIDVSSFCCSSGSLVIFDRCPSSSLVVLHSCSSSSLAILDKLGQFLSEPSQIRLVTLGRNGGLGTDIFLRSVVQAVGWSFLINSANSFLNLARFASSCSGVIVYSPARLRGVY